jgi:hypothetical protein
MRKCAVHKQQSGGLAATDGGAMLTDRERGAARDIAYPDCVIAVVPDDGTGLGPGEIRALRALADAGLVPPLRTAVTARPSVPVPATTTSRVTRADQRAGRPRPAPAPPGVRHTRNSSLTRHARLCERIVKTGPRVSESVETPPALH